MKAPVFLKQVFSSIRLRVMKTFRGVETPVSDAEYCPAVSKAQEEIGKMRARLTYSRLESLSPKYATFRKQVDVHVRYLRANR